jgi:hypothetical protein
MPIFRFKGEVLLVLGVVVLLATGVSNVQIPRAQASTQAKTQALQILVNNKEPVAIVFHLCHFHEKTPTQAASCPMWGNYYYVHNGMALADLKENEPRAEIGHVAEWLTPVKWSICSLDHILTHPQECKHGCPSMAPPTHCNENEAYWVRDRTLGEYNSSVTIENQSNHS